jgi:hypothetical protein
MVCCDMAIVSSWATAEKAHRITLSLDGEWDVEDSGHNVNLPCETLLLHAGRQSRVRVIM